MQDPHENMHLRSSLIERFSVNQNTQPMGLLVRLDNIGICTIVSSSNRYGIKLCGRLRAQAGASEAYSE